MKLKTYNWALEGIAALVLLVGAVAMIITGTQELSGIVLQVVGVGILFFTIMRIKPLLASRNDKDYVIIMTLELFIALVVGIVLLVIPDRVDESNLFSFSRLTGIIFYIRGIVHFYTTSKRYELHDLVGFFVHILLISFGFLFLFNTLEVNVIVYIIYALSFLLVGYFSYRSFNGYKRFRLEKENKLKMQDYLEEEKQEENVIDDPKSIDEQINPEKIDEPGQEDRPHIQ